MTSHKLDLDRDVIEYVDDNLNIVREPSGASWVTCTCGLDSGPVPDEEARRIYNEHARSTRDEPSSA